MNDNFKPYYTVIFTSTKVESQISYSDIANKMVELAAKQQGFTGVESEPNQIGVTVWYWKSLDAIKNNKNNAHYLITQQLGKESFYQSYTLRFCKLEREYSFQK